MGSNATGLTVQPVELASKRLDLLREVVPDFRRLSILVSVGVFFEKELSEVQAAASAFGVDATVLKIRRSEEIAPAFEAIKNNTDALYVFSEPLMNANRQNFARDKARRLTGTTADQIRSHHQSDDRQGAGLKDQGVILAARR
jgi:ABC-type uncharacterized transport system substrate-binding protein